MKRLISAIVGFVLYMWHYDPSFAGCPAGKHSYWHKLCKKCGRYR